MSKSCCPSKPLGPTVQLIPPPKKREKKQIKDTSPFTIPSGANYAFRFDGELKREQNCIFFLASWMLWPVQRQLYHTVLMFLR